MKLASTARMKELDRIAIEERGIPSLDLMERAASAVAAAVLAKLEHAALPEVLVLCGPGNNGGDGFAAARQLLERNVPVRTVLVGDTARMTPDARTMADRLERAGGTVEHWPAVLRPCGCLVDALFGVGLCREVRGDFREAILAANALGCPIVSCDVPSGIHGDTGEIMGEAVRAAQTITFTCAKPGLLQGAGAGCTGGLIVADIGIPADLLRDQPPAIRPGKYRHFKGGEYRVLGTARHSETLEELVVYQALYGAGGIWVRPAAMWNETLERNGTAFSRFTFLED